MQPNTVILGFPGDSVKGIENVQQNEVLNEETQTANTKLQQIWNKIVKRVVQPFFDTEDPRKRLKYDLDKFSKDNNQSIISATEYNKILQDIILCKKNIIIARQ